MPLPFSDWPVPKKEVKQNVIQIYLGRSSGISHFFYYSDEGLRRMCDGLIFQGNTGVNEPYEECPACRGLYAAGITRFMIYDPLDPETWLVDRQGDMKAVKLKNRAQYLNKRPVYGMALPHWNFEGTMHTFGTPHDAFCIRRRYHVLATRNVPGDPGWHISFRPWCSEQYEKNPTPTIPRDEWFADVMAFFGLVGVKWDEQYTSDKGVVHFHERI